MRPALALYALAAAATTLTADPGSFTSNGVKLVYRDDGNKTDFPVVMVHGFLADGTVQWEGKEVGDTNVVKALTKAKFRVIRLDSRGHGGSDRPAGAAKYGAAMTGDVVALMKHLDVKKAHLVGYSLGSWTVQKVAAERPDLVQSLTVGGAGALDPLGAEGIVLIAGRVKVAANDPAGAVAAMVKTEFEGRLALPTPAHAAVLADVAAGAKGLMLAPDKVTAYPGPVLGLVGTEDKLRPTVYQLQEKRVAAHKKMDVKDVKDATHVNAPFKADFSGELVPFLKANTP
jgi:pimeloyl-ACP methyl ester carboxylesterase